MDEHYEVAYAMFGGDDFGQTLPLEWLKKAIDSGESVMRISLAAGSFGFELPI